MNFQQSPQTLQSQRYGCAVRHSVGGIACDIRGKLAGRESCATTHSTAGSAAGSAGGSTAGSAPATCQRSGTVDTADANNLPKLHRDRSRDHAQARDETTTSNTNFPALTSRKVATKPTRFVHPPSWLPPTSIPTFPHQKAEKSPFQQHAVSYNPTNTSGPLTQARTICTAAASPTNCTYSKGPTLWPTPSSIPSTQCKSPDAVPFSDRLSQRILLLNDFHCRGSSCGKH